MPATEINDEAAAVPMDVSPPIPGQKKRKRVPESSTTITTSDSNAPVVEDQVKQKNAKKRKRNRLIFEEEDNVTDNLDNTPQKLSPNANKKVLKTGDKVKPGMFSVLPYSGFHSLSHHFISFYDDLMRV